LGLLGTVFFIQTFSYRFTVGLFPRLVNSILAFLCFYRLGKNIRVAWAGGEAKKAKTENARRGLAWYWSFLVSVSYFGLVCLIGFVWATGVLLFVFPILAGFRKWVTIAAVAVLSSVFIQGSFNLFLEIPLPEGILFSWIK